MHRSLCLLCKKGKETIAHFLLDCTTFEIIRQHILKDIKHILRNCGLDLNNKEMLLRLLINCSAVIDSKTVSVTHFILRDIEDFLWCLGEKEIEKLNLENPIPV